MSGKDKWVRRFSVDETAKHKNGFTIYKIKSVLFPYSSPEAVSVVCAWKRYSDVQRLHASMRSLHAGLHLRGTFPPLARHSYFKRFQPEVIEERAKTIKTILEFIAEHRLLFTSTDFVNFLQNGYPEPDPPAGGVINAIRSSLQLPIEEQPPLEYHTDDDDSRSELHPAKPQQTTTESTDETDFISQIPIYEAADVEIRRTPLSAADSFDSIASLDSISSDLFEELSKVSVESRPSVKCRALPDLITFDAPSTSRFDGPESDATSLASNVCSSTSVDDRRSGSRLSLYSKVSVESRPSVKCRALPDLITFDAPSTSRFDGPESDATSLASNVCSSTSVDDRRSGSRLSLYSKRSVLSLSAVESKTKTEDSYVFEAGYMLNLAARCVDMQDYQRAFECYKSGIEKMLIGVQNDSDPQRRALIKEKTNKYLSYAEAIYKNHLCDNEQSLLPERLQPPPPQHCPVPLSMVRRGYAELGAYRVLAVLGARSTLVLHRADQACYAMKVIQKIPNNLTEFDEYFLQNTKETREPILPTVIPYMVPLHAYIETNNLIFLILAYAPGEKLFDYIKNYAKSVPNTPAREVNLENVFSEPKVTRDLENDNVVLKDIGVKVESVNNNDGDKTEKLDNGDMSVNDLVINSQKLLMNVDRVLSETKTDVAERVADDDVEVERKVLTPNLNVAASPRDVLPPSAVCLWGAEILTALESLHNCGVVCRDLNPSNILLGSRGQVLLTYFACHRGPAAALSAAHRHRGTRREAYVAPELRAYTGLDRDKDESMERLCDYWSFGAIMYELLCGVPLSHYHPTVFTSHTILQLPEGLSVEVESLLTQLLTYDPLERLGSGKDGVEEIKRHPYFRHVDWRRVYDSWTVPG